MYYAGDWLVGYDAGTGYLENDDENGHVIRVGYCGDDAEDAVEEEARDAHEEEQVVQKWHGVVVDVQATELAAGQNSGDGHEHQQRRLWYEVDPNGRHRVVLVAEGQEEEEDADDGGDEDEETGEQTPIGRMTVDVDDQLIPPQIISADVVTVPPVAAAATAAATSAPIGSRFVLAHILPHNEPNADCKWFQPSKRQWMNLLSSN